jgi:oxepin-CoA hydrolase/3-oxo-5,6-dehydrosuberyl-CoA semialdehyde dehydrogenase
VKSSIDPAKGAGLANTSSQGVDLEAALSFARTRGGPGLRHRTCSHSAELLAKVAGVLAANRDDYFLLTVSEARKIVPGRRGL